MGYECHHAIIVSAWDFDLELIKVVRKKIKEKTTLRPSKIVQNGCCGLHSFLVPPDGSKEGWEESDKGDDDRDTVIDILRKHEHTDGSNPLVWVEVMFGDDNGEDRVTRTGNVSAPRDVSVTAEKFDAGCT